MKKAKPANGRDDELRAEYDFSKLKGAVRGKYYKRYRAGKNSVRFTMVAVPNELVPQVQSLISQSQRG